MSEDFQRFFDRSTRVVERALCEMADANLFVDYTGGYGDDDNEGLDGDKFGEINEVHILMISCFFKNFIYKTSVSQPFYVHSTLT